MRAHPVRLFGGITLALALLLWIAIRQVASTLDALISWLVAISLVSLLTYGYDKAIASSRRTRVPEVVLLGLALVGGTPGAVAGMGLFRHKTAKRPFQVRLALIVLVQIVSAGTYYLWIRPSLLER